MGDDLEARLQGHSQAFEGLMSLIPAKYYYGEDNSDQWQRKKQTKEEKKAAKRAKLEPGALRSALDVHNDNERKRKRESREHEHDDESGPETEGKEQPGQGMKVKSRSTKKQKTQRDGETTANELDDESAKRTAKAEKRREKRERKKAKVEKKKQKLDAKRARKEAETSGQDDDIDLDPSTKVLESDHEDPILEDNAKQKTSNDTVEMEHHGTEPSKDLSDSSTSSTPARVLSPTFDASVNHSSASSTSSIPPPPGPDQPQSQLKELPLADSTPTTAENAPEPTTTRSTETEAAATQKPDKLPPLPAIDKDILRARVQARIADLRAARKADGPDGRPARNRQELIEARRKKAEERKAVKKAQRQAARNADAESEADAEAARLRGASGSDSPLFADSPAREDRFAFGRVEFGDGSVAQGEAGRVRDPWSRRKGPSDVKTALEAAKKKQEKLASVGDAEKRQEIDEKDRWLNAKKRVHGEKVKDDAGLLKKTLKRKEKAKDKSGKEWDERLQGVQKSKDAKQKRREDNLLKRKDGGGAAGKKTKGKLGKGKGKAGGAPGKQQANKKKRPGFEGTFKTGGGRRGGA